MIYISVSNLSYSVVCSKRCKLQSLKQVSKGNSPSNCMATGTKLHECYNNSSIWTFQKEELYSKLSQFADEHGNYTRQFNDEVTVRGKFDDLVLLSDNIVSVTEVKTTSKDFLFSYEYDIACFQVQLYGWILKPLLESIGYKLADTLYVEVYSQNEYEYDGSHRLIKRIPVSPLSDVEMYSVIDTILQQWIGIKAMQYPPDWICRYCVKQVKLKCNRWISAHRGER